MRGLLTVAVSGAAITVEPPSIRLGAAYRLSPRVALRPEPFGALAYHFGNRRLSFLRSPDIVALVEALGDHPSLADALVAVGVDERRWPSFQRALATLVASEMVEERSDDDADD